MNKKKKLCLGFTILFIAYWSLLISVSNAVIPNSSASGSISGSYDEWSVSFGEIPEGDTISVSVTVTSGEIQIMGILDSSNRADFLASGAVYWEAGMGEHKSSGNSWSDSYVVPDTDTYYFCVGSGSGGVSFTYTVSHNSVALGNLMSYVMTGIGSGVFLAVVLFINKLDFTGSLE
ncbi:MAG: hypothetical protein GY870_18280 [archaeon]|nr:hypothetical protein [archaeon]